MTSRSVLVIAVGGIMIFGGLGHVSGSRVEAESGIPVLETLGLAGDHDQEQGDHADAVAV